MPKDAPARVARHGRQLDSQQCQYPGGNCHTDRTHTKNGELHWLCVEHRDHQNALQRDRYRRAAKKTKEKATTTKKVQEKKEASHKKKKARFVPPSNDLEEPADTLPAIEPECPSAEIDCLQTEHVEPTTNGVRSPSDGEDVQENASVATLREVENSGLVQGVGVFGAS
ncbi:hypothetical protein PI124_g9202 [Phytophthora idaei]|nr:hypothetical protein PI125_g9110 [Phytophthora idaei]KAG3158430.1 hypothetical protein PI126_g7848 [Phytophthora idaei]KAG3246065.1 hypothetical protein PI124_g9202 [Phytophthora idaei]